MVNPYLQSPRYRILRTMSFVVTGFSALAPITHAAVIFPYNQLDKQAGLRHYYIEEGILLIGVVFYIVGCPCVTGEPTSYSPSRVSRPVSRKDGSPEYLISKGHRIRYSIF